MEILVLIGVIAVVVYFAARGRQASPKSNELVIGVSTSHDRDRPHSKSTNTDRWGRDDDFVPEPGQDNWERFNFYGARLWPAKGRYRITYTDQKGMTTERDIDIKRVYEDGEQYAMDAFCHLRGEHRSFIDNRIKTAVDLDSGEVVRSVAQHATAQFSDSGQGLALAAIEREWMAAALLSFVCRADGRMLKAERVIVADYFKRRCPDLKHDDAALDGIIKTIGEPDQREFKRIIFDMKAAGDMDRLRDIFDCAKRIVATQKTVDPMEAAALEILKKAAT